MLTRLSYRINAALEGYLPEQRLFLKSDRATRFIRLRPLTQAALLSGLALTLGWTIIATAIFLMDSIGAESGRAQVARQQALYEERLTSLASESEIRAEEAARAQERFNLALDQVSYMQSALLALEERRRELETGIEVIQATLRRTIEERDQARTELSALTEAVLRQGGGRSPEARAKDAQVTLAFMNSALGRTARERDRMETEASAAREETAAVKLAKREIELRNEAIFSRLEEAVAVSMEPLDTMFRAAGLSPDDLLDQVRRGYSGQGGPLGPFTMSAAGAPLTPDELRAETILQGLDRMNMYRIAAVKTPFAVPVKDAFRFTSGFGFRRDPKGAGRRMHAGTDFAASYGTPIYATADGVVTGAGWENGYGRMITIRHEFGIETRYAHLSDIRVDVGQRVSRGERIGDMGNSGRSTGTHLHYEVRIGKKAVDPMSFIKAAKHVF